MEKKKVKVINKRIVIDKRGIEYTFEENDDGTVNIRSIEGEHLNIEVSGNAFWMLRTGDCEYPLDVDEWDEWIHEI